MAECSNPRIPQSHHHGTADAKSYRPRERADFAGRKILRSAASAGLIILEATQGEAEGQGYEATPGIRFPGADRGLEGRDQSCAVRSMRLTDQRSMGAPQRA
jgi:hypothetical protein